MAGDERAMLKIKKILLPVDFPNTSLHVIHQAAAFAHHFHSEIVMLHVATAESHAAGVPEDGPEFARVGRAGGDPSRGRRKTWITRSRRSWLAWRSGACW